MGEWFVTADTEFNYQVKAAQVTGYAVRKYHGTGTAFETVARPVVGVTDWGAVKRGAWHTKGAAEFVAAALNAGEPVENVDFAMYSND